MPIKKTQKASPRRQTPVTRPRLHEASYWLIEFFMDVAMRFDGKDYQAPSRRVRALVRDAEQILDRVWKCNRNEQLFFFGSTAHHAAVEVTTLLAEGGKDKPEQLAGSRHR